MDIELDKVHSLFFLFFYKITKDLDPFPPAVPPTLSRAILRWESSSLFFLPFFLFSRSVHHSRPVTAIQECFPWHRKRASFPFAKRLSIKNLKRAAASPSQLLLNATKLDCCEVSAVSFLSSEAIAEAVFFFLTQRRTRDKKVVKRTRYDA